METQARFGQRTEMPAAAHKIPSSNATQHDRPSLLLWIGALTLPSIFGWYLLSWRYNGWTRFFGFSWSALATASLLIFATLRKK